MPALLWTPHPVVPVPSAEQMQALYDAKGAQAVLDVWKLREAAIERAKRDPLRYGYEPEVTWGKVRSLIKAGARDILILGGNRASKTEIASKLMVELLTSIPNARVWAGQETDAACTERLEPYIYKHLPPEWRDLGKSGKTTYIKYTKATGFADHRFVCPNGSFYRSMFYTMDLRNFEGEELDGFWGDELIGVEMAETIRYRLVTRGGLFLLTFTPKDGWTDTVKVYLDTGRVVEWRPAPLLDQRRVHVPGGPPGHMPFVIQCAKPGRFVVCFFSEDNPFGGYENIVKELVGKSEEEIKVRAYGWPTKARSGAFPKFSDVHIVSPDKVPKQGTRYLAMDPAASRNWFMVWALADDLGRVFIYREWPDASLGEWAVPWNKPDGKAGEAQHNGAGRSVGQYKQLILDLEGKGKQEPEAIYKRLIDPRAGAAAVPSVGDGMTLIDIAAGENRLPDGRIVDPMIWYPAPGSAIDDGIALINELLDYDTEKPVDPTNCPRLYVSSACQNLIYCLRTHTGAGGLKAATTDPIGCLRYLFTEGVEYVDEAAWSGHGFGGVY